MVLGKLKCLYKNWFVHSMLGHPAMAICHLVNYKPLNVFGVYMHDVTLPEYNKPPTNH